MTDALLARLHAEDPAATALRELFDAMHALDIAVVARDAARPGEVFVLAADRAYVCTNAVAAVSSHLSNVGLLFATVHDVIASEEEA